MKWSGLKGADGGWGGDLVDVDTPFAGKDKVVHLVLGSYAYLLADRWLRLPWWAGLLIVLVLAILNEVVEDIRYRAGAKGLLVDEADGTDVLVTVAGGVVAWALL